MNYTHARDSFIAAMASEGLPVDTARKLLRYATTLDRLAVAQCNGDYPCDNGDRKVAFCPRCESGFVTSAFRKSDTGERVCVDCRTAELVRAVLPAGFEPIFGGDPRGAVLKLRVPSGRTNTWGQDGIAVPTR